MSERTPRLALIVAGGFGTRLYPLTYEIPKPLIPFCGAPFLEGVIARLADAGIEQVWLVVGNDTEPFEELRPAAEELGVELDTVPEPEPLDTAGGVRSVAGRFDGPVLVLNGDILTDVDYRQVMQRHREADADATLVLTEVDDTSSYGVAVRGDGTRIERFVEKPDPGTLPGENAINAGTYVLEPEVLLAHDEGRLSFERAVFPALLERGGHVEGFVWKGVWADLGTPDRFRDGHRLALDGELDWPTLQRVPVAGPGVRVASGARIAADADLVAPVLVLDDARIGPGATIGPYAVVGREVEVGQGATVSDGAVLFDGVSIGAGVVARGLLAGTDARVETGAGVGRDVVLGEGESVAHGESLADGERRPDPDA